MDVSIIMPVYNAERFVREAIEGVLQQSFSGSYELLVADDQSKDSTSSILAEFATQYGDKIKVKNNLQNLGCSANSISIAKQAKGKYFAFCDADDIWIDPYKLQKQFDFLEQNGDYDMICADAKIVDEYGTYMSDKASMQKNDKDIDIYTLIRQHGDVYNSSIMMRADFYKKMLDDCSWFEKQNCFFDTIWSWYAAKNSRLRYMDEPMIAFRSLTNSDSRSSDPIKSKQLEKKYYMMKLAFVISQHFDMDRSMDILLSEYDYFTEQNYRIGLDEGANKVRESKSYKIGRFVTKFFKRK